MLSLRQQRTAKGTKGTAITPTKRASAKSTASKSKPPKEEPASDKKRFASGFTHMFYKASGSLALREIGGHQLFQIRHESRELMTEVLCKASHRIASGHAVDKVKIWAVGQCK